MSFRAYTLAFTAATPIRLSNVYSDPTRGGVRDESFLQISVSADTQDAFLGADNTVSSTQYAVRVFVATNATYPIEIGPFVSGPFKLSDIWVVGAGSGNLHILGVPF